MATANAQALTSIAKTTVVARTQPHTGKEKYCYAIAQAAVGAPSVWDDWFEASALTQNVGYAAFRKIAGKARYLLSLIFIYGGGFADSIPGHKNAPVESKLSFYLNFRHLRHCSFADLVERYKNKPEELLELQFFFTISAME
jgi:hypothetical protein